VINTMGLQFSSVSTKVAPNKIKQDDRTFSCALQELTNGRLGLEATHGKYLTVCNG
jgi:hypothetical protein